RGGDHRFSRAGPLMTWSENWLAYTSYAGVVVPALEWQQAPPEIKVPLMQYVECGGSLIVAGSWSAPPGWERTKTILSKEWTAYYPGFGQCLVTTLTEVPKWRNEDWPAVHAMWRQSSQHWRGLS